MVCLVILAITSCIKYHENPNAFYKIAPELLIGQVQLAYMNHMEGNAARQASYYDNHFHGCDRSYLTSNTYGENRGSYNDMWSDVYIEGISIAKLVIENKSSSPLLKGVAQILQGSLYAEMALLFGDVPYSQAVNPDEYPHPVYDAQQSVVEGGIALIKAGIANVGDVTISEGYGGNRLAGGTWTVAANTLVARYELSLGNYDAAIAAATNGIDKRAEDLVTQHGTEYYNKNLFYQFTVDERDGYLFAADNSRKGNQSHLYNLLKSSTISGSEVTRVLDTSGDFYRFSHYFIDSEYGIVRLNYNIGVRFAQTASFPLASYNENQLILAEANYKKSSKDEAPARTHLNNVRTELVNEYNAIGFKDVSGNTITITQNKFPKTNASGDLLLRQILEEKYITLVGEIVTFHDLRRTGNFLNVPLKKQAIISTFPQRFLYPQSEIDYNKNVPKPVPGFIDKTTVFWKSY